MELPTQLAPSKAGCLIRIKSAVEILKPAEQAIATFILADPVSVIHMSISELAHRAEVGESTVVRFCRTLGYNGYQEFKLRLAQDVVEPSEFIHDKISFQDSTADLAAKIFQANLKVVEDTRRSLDTAGVDEAAKLLASARKIEIYGVSYSFFTALDLKHKLTRLGRIADAYGDGHLQAMGASALTKDDVAVGISHSGGTRDVLDALEIAREAGAKVVSVTNFSPCPITRVADVALLTAAADTPLGGEVLTSRIAQLCVIDVLSAAIAVRLGESCLQFIQKASEAIKKKRD
jgi:hypothetical protein